MDYLDTISQNTAQERLLFKERRKTILFVVTLVATILTAIALIITGINEITTDEFNPATMKIGSPMPSGYEKNLYRATKNRTTYTIKGYPFSTMIFCVNDTIVEISR